jgi:hypothetical protein
VCLLKFAADPPDLNAVGLLGEGARAHAPVQELLHRRVGVAVHRQLQPRHLAAEGERHVELPKSEHLTLQGPVPRSRGRRYECADAHRAGGRSTRRPGLPDVHYKNRLTFVGLVAN